MNKLSPHGPPLLALALCLVLGAGCTKASKIRHFLADAERDFQAQNYDKAEIEYQSVLRLSPLHPAAIRGLALIYSEEGRPQFFVLPYLKKAHEQDKTNSEVQLKLAEIYGSEGKLKEALSLLESILQTDPLNEHALVRLAQVSSTNALASLRQRLATRLQQGSAGAAGCLTALGWIDLRSQKLGDAAAAFQKASTLDPKLASPYLGMAAVCTLGKDSKGTEQALRTAAALSPIRSSARLKYVDFKMQNRAAAEAMDMLREMTRQAPDYFPGWVYLMKASFAEHKYDECQAAMDKILARDHFNFDALLQAGNLAMAQRDTAKALSTFQHLDFLYKNIPQVKYDLGMAYLLNNEKQNATVKLNEALSLDRNYAPAVLLLAELDTRMGNQGEAISLLSQFIKNHPDSAQARTALADAYLASQQPDDAIEVYQQMLLALPKNPEIPRRMGLIYQTQAQAAKARAAFEKSLDLSPDYLPALRNITELDLAAKQYAQAQRRLDGVAQKNPKAADLLVLQGDIFQAQGQINQAEAAFSKAIELNPQLPDPYLALARLYLATHQEPQALDRLQALVEKTKDLKAMLLIGEIHQMAGRYEQARDAFEKVLANDAKNFVALNNLAYVDAEFLGNLDRALQLAQTARDLQPNNPSIADTLGWVLFKKRQYAHAAALLQESAAQQPNDPEVQLHLGLTYYMLEEEAPARVSLQRAVASHTDFHGKDLARRRLAVLNLDPANDTPAVVEELQSLLREDPKDPVPLSRLASIQERHGEVEKAVASLQTLLTLNPQDAPAMIRLSALYADRLHDLRKALDLAKSAHSLTPADGRACALLGDLVYRSGDYPWALSLLEQAANQSSDQPSVMYDLAWAYYATGRVNDADAAMQKALQQGDSLPNLAQAKQFLALRAAAKDPAQAQASSALVRQILQKEPNNVPALMVSALLAERRSAVAETEQVCQKVLSIYPLFAPAMRQLAILYSQNSGDLDQAYALAQKARASMPDDLELAKTLGLLAYRKADYDRSMLLLRESAQKAGDNPEVLYYLGLDYYHLKQRSQSKQALQHALDLRLPQTQADEARRILKELK